MHGLTSFLACIEQRTRDQRSLVACLPKKKEAWWLDAMSERVGYLISNYWWLNLSVVVNFPFSYKTSRHFLLYSKHYYMTLFNSTYKLIACEFVFLLI